MHNYGLLIISLFLVLIGNAQPQTVIFNNPSITYEGRINYRVDAAELSWPGTSATINFEGTSGSAILQDLDTANYYNVIVDNRVINKIHVEKEKKSFVLDSDLADGKHLVQLFKRTERDKGKTLFYGFELPNGEKLLPPPSPKKRKIEFDGNSRTCGYANEDSEGKDRWYGYFQNNYLTYAAINLSSILFLKSRFSNCLMIEGSLLIHFFDTQTLNTIMGHRFEMVAF